MSEFLVLWDLDGTLCPHSPTFHQQAPQAVANAALAAGVGLSAEAALEFARANYPGQKTAVQAFATRFNLDAQALFQLYYHHLKPDFLTVDAAFNELIKKSTVAMRHGVFTQAPAIWINKALDELGLLHHFDNRWLLGYERLGRSPKNSELTYTTLADELARGGYSPHQVAIIDDRDFILQQLEPLAQHRVCISSESGHTEGLLYTSSIMSALQYLFKKLALLDSGQGSVTVDR
jgi:FMN phosphatase YigB (HAD superfamily)